MAAARIGNVTEATAAAREAARERTGRFGEQPKQDPGMVLNLAADPDLAADITDWAVHPWKHDPEKLLRRVADHLAPERAFTANPIPDSHVRPSNLTVGMSIFHFGHWSAITGIEEPWDDRRGNITVNIDNGYPVTYAGNAPIPYSPHPVTPRQAATLREGDKVWRRDNDRWETVVANVPLFGRSTRVIDTDLGQFLAQPHQPVDVQDRHR